MEIIVLYSVAAMGLGILIGLLPSLPVFLAPLLMLPFAQAISTEVMLMVWMLSLIGSQYFGSVAVITTRIPGEETALIYINDLDQLSTTDKIDLIRETAFGSMVAGVIAAALLYVCFHWLKFVNSGVFAMAWVQALVYSLLLICFVIMEKSKWAWAVVLAAVGIVLSTKNNNVLPSWWQDIQYWFDDKTPFLLTLGLLIIPSLLEKYQAPVNVIAVNPGRSAKKPWLPAVVGSLTGFVAGLIPGPAAYTGSFTAYNFFKKIKDRIVSAESANNSALIAQAVTLFLTAIPISQNTLLLSAAMDVNSVEINKAVWEIGSFGLPIVDQLIVAVVISSVIYYFLSTHFISAYVKIIEFFHHRKIWILLLILTGMCLLDVNTSHSDPVSYTMLLAFFSLAGVTLQRYRISPMPLLFACLLGDKAVWAFIQISQIYF
jgi:putative tricarboxylic transport membrane protein